MLLDTSGLLSAHHVREPAHADARGLLASAPRVVTHNYVLAEFVALAEARGLARLPALAFLTQLAQIPKVEVVWVTQPLHEGAMALLTQRADKTYSLCDAVSFVLMRQHRITDALTTDRHFEQEGFRRLLG